MRTAVGGYERAAYDRGDQVAWTMKQELRRYCTSYHCARLSTMLMILFPLVVFELRRYHLSHLLLPKY